MDATRRKLLGLIVTVPVAAACEPPAPGAPATATGASSVPVPATHVDIPTGTAPLRKLGGTGALVEAFSLGGEGVLRTHGREREAVPMILEALRLGVRYFDTAPAYAGSQGYYGAAFREAGAQARAGVFLASKTHERTREGALALLDDSLARLGTDHLDLWQLHDLRSRDDLDRIFAKDGAIEAVREAKADGRIRHVGITGHHDPAILVEAMGRFDFDTVLAAMNPADPRRSPFLSTVVVEARRRKMGVIGMKSLGVGRIVADGVARADELMRYAASFADTVIIGCRTIEEVRANLAIARSLQTMTEQEIGALEARVAPHAHNYDTFKA